jgi:hypothetical protein
MFLDHVLVPDDGYVFEDVLADEILVELDDFGRELVLHLLLDLLAILPQTLHYKCKRKQASFERSSFSTARKKPAFRFCWQCRPSPEDVRSCYQAASNRR